MDTGELQPPDYKGWNEGLNEFVVIRHEKFEGKPPPYYGESMVQIRYAKAIAYAVIAIVPYFTVLDTLGNLKPASFEPCNTHTCHYMRLFNSDNIPGTGVDVMSVQNGVERPVALHYLAMAAYSCPHKTHNRSFQKKLWGPYSKACPIILEHQMHSFLQDHPETQAAVDLEHDKADEFTSSLRFAFYITKFPLCIFAYPMNVLSKYNRIWGMEHVPVARCPGLTKDEMQDRCKDPAVQGRLVNHLFAYGPAKVLTVAGLGGYAAFTALHDAMLLYGRSEMETLTLGWLAIVCLGVAAAAVFFWAMGAAEVFVAPAGDNGDKSCMCFYRIPEITALVGLSTPFALFASFAGKVQMQGLANLFGDYLSYQTYIVPHYLARQSFLWTWAMLCSPKMAGTTKGKKRQEFSPNDWGRLQLMQQSLYYMMLVLQAVVALSASAFMIAFKELCVSLYMRGDMTSAVQWVIKFVLMPAPSLVTLGVGAYAAYELWTVTVGLPDGVKFWNQLDTFLPECMTCCFSCLKDNNTLDKCVGGSFLVIGWLVLGVWTVSVAQGLCPDRNFLLGKEHLHYPRLVQAELWGACGFIFFFVHIPRVMAIAFSTWDDLESLKNLADKDSKNKYSQLSG